MRQPVITCGIRGALFRPYAATEPEPVFAAPEVAVEGLWGVVLQVETRSPPGAAGCSGVSTSSSVRVPFVNVLLSVREFYYSRR
ncbi:hypothetical protein KCP75_24975 [Salmonella enterica subsp. enterica]|nr:hypothetical protein KCP75_24975 [Salmonella enterica subsp. enterica]